MGLQIFYKKKQRPLCFHNFANTIGFHQKNLKKILKNKILKKTFYQKRRPLCFHNFMSRPGICKKIIKMAAKKFKMAAKMFIIEF